MHNITPTLMTREDRDQLAVLDHCAAKLGARQLTIRWQNSRDKWHSVCLPYAVAFTVSRSIATEIGDVVYLYGEYGLVTFRRDGSGFVEWNSRSTLPGSVTEFDEHTLVAI